MVPQRHKERKRNPQSIKLEIAKPTAPLNWRAKLKLSTWVTNAVKEFLVNLPLSRSSLRS